MSEKNRWEKISIIFFCLIFIFSLAHIATAASKPQKPTALPYKSSGVISGTSLTYENLFINNSGRITLTICNPDTSGVIFSANFGFYTSKGEYLTGFALKGFAGRIAKTDYSLQLAEHNKIKKASYMKVLGRAGRSIDD